MPTYNTPSDFAVAHIVTANEWNSLNGVSGSLAAVKSSLTSISLNQPARAFSTNYQNTTGKLMLITVSIYNNATTTNNYNMVLYCNSTTGPSTTPITAWNWWGTPNIVSDQQGSCTMLVPVDFYYRVQAAGTLYKWNEWTLL